MHAEGGFFKRHGLTILLLIMVAVGAGLIAYPSFSDWWNKVHQARIVDTYASTVANMKTDDYKKILADGDAYNAKLAEIGLQWMMNEEQKADYNEKLAVDNTGIMGYIDIPKIDVHLGVYHGTEDEVLTTSIGHLEGTSLPVGGETSHCVLSGHRGLPSARLFTDLDKLVEGDTWTITVLNRTLTYEVDRIRVVTPENLSDLKLEEGKDLCTLVTCTPYGINTHRLLVRGHRVDNSNGNADVIADAIQIETIYIAPFIAGPILMLLLIIMLVTTGRRRSEAKRKGDRDLVTMLRKQRKM